MRPFPCLAVILALVSGCAASVDPMPDGASAVSCVHDADCAPGQRCGYRINPGCTTGVCVVRPTPSPCGAIQLLTACGCDGTDIHWTGGCSPELPTGYAPAPAGHTGPCADAH